MILKLVSGWFTLSTGITFIIHSFIKYPLPFEQLSDVAAIMILLSIFCLCFGLWQIGDSTKNKEERRR